MDFDKFLEGGTNKDRTEYLKVAAELSLEICRHGNRKLRKLKMLHF